MTIIEKYLKDLQSNQEAVGGFAIDSFGPPLKTKEKIEELDEENLDEDFEELGTITW